MSFLATFQVQVSLQFNPCAHRAAEWLLNSGIQDNSGGVARFYRTDLREYARLSTEITGYAISFLVYLYERSHDSRYLTAAEHAGTFLVERAWLRDLAVFPFEYPARDDGEESFAYFFDSGIIIRGLLALDRVRKDGRFRDVAITAGHAMYEDFSTRDGAFHPILRLPQKSALPYSSQWSRSPGCYQLKSALAWHDLHETTGEAKYLSWYRAAVESALDGKDKFLPGETPEKTMDRLHAYAYFLEGLLPCREQSECAEALRKGIARVSRYLRSIAPAFERSDVYAQLLRLRLLSGIPVEQNEAEDEAKQISGFQLRNHDARLDGSFAFGRKGQQMLPYANPVSTSFCVQALLMWEDYRFGAPVDRRSLI